MCGITGYIGQGDRATLEAMIASLKHRGPDDQGIFLRDHVGLGHTRLSIIDLSPTGHQPMLSPDSSTVIVFNGEIYNFKELRKECERTGYVFKGNSDTEVILALYEHEGEAVFSRLNGMFAIAIYDFKKNRLILARDRMGKKPLYYGREGGNFFFGSELKALKAYPFFRASLDLSSVNKYLLYEYVPTPHTIYQNVYKLEPASYLVYDGVTVSMKKFWRADFTQHHFFHEKSGAGFAEKRLPLAEALHRLDQKLTDSVSARLVSDVPLGIFLSGGLDSSTIAYYAQKISDQKIKTFSIGFTEASFDESSYARVVAKTLGTDHHEKIFSVKDCLDVIPKIAALLDEPMADASILPTYLLSAFTREQVTVALGGDGGDELFAGYPTFQAHRFARWYATIPSSLRQHVIERILTALPVSHTNMSFDFLAKRFIKGMNMQLGQRQQTWLGSFDRTTREKLLKPEVWSTVQNENEFDVLDRYQAEIGPTAPENQLIYQYLRTYMMDQVLVKVDRASMYNSLEVRAPFLDYILVDFVNSLPYTFKLHGFTTKFILKKLMEGKLPREIIYRKKKGFGVPMGAWLRNELKDFMLDTLSRDAIHNGGIFNYDYIKILINDHLSNAKNNRKELWTLMVFQMWMKNWA